MTPEKLARLEREENERLKAEAEKEKIIGWIEEVIRDDPKALARILYDLGCRSPW
jgi:hypothetical protein